MDPCDSVRIDAQTGHLVSRNSGGIGRRDREKGGVKVKHRDPAPEKSAAKREMADPDCSAESGGAACLSGIRQPGRPAVGQPAGEPAGLAETKAPVGRVSAIIVAAGESRRMGQKKPWLSLLGRPLLWYTLCAFQQATTVGQLVLVVRPDDREAAGRLLAENCWAKPIVVTDGGATRQQSVAKGLAAVTEGEWIAVHDGARPLVTPELIDRVAYEAARCGAATAAVRAVDTVKEADGDGFITATPDRARLWQVQTPQIFEAAAYRAAMAAALAAGEEFTDDCQLMERAGARVKLVEGSRNNFKVTVPEDLPLAQAVLTERRRTR